MNKFGLTALAISALMLQGCAAALVPVAAGGLLVKTRIDAANRTRKAEAALTAAPEPVVIVGNTAAENMALLDKPTPSQEPTEATEVAALPIPEIPGMPSSNAPVRADIGDHPYRAFVQYALTAADKKEAATSMRSAVLREQVSLADPKTMSCDYKPLAVMIDLDQNAGFGEPSKPVVATLGDAISAVRARGIKVIWLTDTNQTGLPQFLGPLRDGASPVINADDLVSFGARKGKRKQERRWQLARDYCIVAIAGDTKTDFDELYDYLRDQSYAIRLDMFWNRGWFLLPAPASVIGDVVTQSIPQSAEPL